MVLPEITAGKINESMSIASVTDGSIIFRTCPLPTGRGINSVIHQAMQADSKVSGEELTYDPRRLQGVMVYRAPERSFAQGDRGQFTAPYHAENVMMHRVTDSCGTILIMAEW